jgi:hypothetical protein
LARLVDDYLCVLLDQFLELGVASQSLLEQRHLLRSDVAGGVFAMLPALQLVVGSRWGRAVLEGVSGELAALHELDLGDLGQEVRFGGRVHVYA